MQECRNARNAGMQECKKCRNAGMQECRKANVSQPARFAFLHFALVLAFLDFCIFTPAFRG
jgi:hypothetical protein